MPRKKIPRPIERDELRFKVLEIWKKTIGIRELRRCFDFSHQCLMKFTLLILEFPELTMSIEQIRNLKLTSEDWQKILEASGGKRPSVYSLASFKFALKASELINHIKLGKGSLDPTGLDPEDLNKEIVILASKYNENFEVKRNCIWFSYCSKIILMNRFVAFSCSECPRTEVEDPSSRTAWLSKSSERSILGKLFF